MSHFAVFFAPGSNFFPLGFFTFIIVVLSFVYFRFFSLFSLPTFGFSFLFVVIVAILVAFSAPLVAGRRGTRTGAFRSGGISNDFTGISVGRITRRRYGRGMGDG